MLKNKILEILKIGRLRRRKKYQKVEPRKHSILSTIYLWWIFGTCLEDASLVLVPGQPHMRPFFNCRFVNMVSAGFIETDELINELDRPGKLSFYILHFLLYTMPIAHYMDRCCWKTETFSDKLSFALIL